LRPLRKAPTLGATALSAVRFLAFKQKSNSGEAGAEWSNVMMVFAVEDRDIVAGDKTGAGAADVVWVWDMIDRDLSRKAIRAYDATRFSPKF
jgi:hypothetical protein